MKITNKTLLDLFLGLKSVMDLPGAKFSYAVSRNLDKIKGEINAIQRADSPTKSFIEFDKARIKLAEEFCERDDEGNLLMTRVDGIERYDIRKTIDFEKAFDKLKENHKQAVSDRREQVKEFNEIMEKEVEVDLYLIPPEHLPEEINSNQLAKIMPMVKE